MIDLPTAKAHLRVDASDEDSLIATYLAAAKATVEGVTSKPLTPTEVTQTEDGFPRSLSGDKPIRLWNGPVAGDVISIEYDDGNGDTQTLSNFRLIEGSDAKLLPAYGECWPATICGQGTVRVTYTAGFAADEIPPALDHAVLLLTAHFYANREAAVVSVGSSTIGELPLGVQTLVRPYHTPRLG